MKVTANSISQKGRQQDDCVDNNQLDIMELLDEKCGIDDAEKERGSVPDAPPHPEIKGATEAVTDTQTPVKITDQHQCPSEDPLPLKPCVPDPDTSAIIPAKEKPDNIVNKTTVGGLEAAPTTGYPIIETDAIRGNMDVNQTFSSSATGMYKAVVNPQAATDVSMIGVAVTPPPKYAIAMTVGDFSELVGVSISTVYCWMANHKTGKAEIMGKTYVWLPEMSDKFNEVQSALLAKGKENPYNLEFSCAGYSFNSQAGEAPKAIKIQKGRMNS